MKVRNLGQSTPGRQNAFLQYDMREQPQQIVQAMPTMPQYMGYQRPQNRRALLQLYLADVQAMRPII